MTHRFTAIALATTCATLLLSACAGMSSPSMTFKQDSLPDAVKVPAGHKVALETSIAARSPISSKVTK